MDRSLKIKAMANKSSEAPIVDVEEVYSKGEQYIEKNKKSLSIIAGVVIAFIGLYFGYEFLVLQPQSEEARQEMWKAQHYFEVDSFNLALNGDGQFLGFLDLADEYSSVEEGNLCNYYIGICYLRQGMFEDAIDYLKEFDSSDEVVGPMATGCIGDAYLELGDTDNALSYYEQAANQRNNEFTTPMFLKKAGDLYAFLGDNAKAIKAYERIKYDYPGSEQARTIDKFLSRAELAQ